MKIKKGTFGERNRKGAAAVEFAVVLPLLVMLVFGIIEFSVALFDKAVITNASREGARVGILFRAERDGGTEDAEIMDTVNTYIANNLITFGEPNNANVTIDREGFEVGDSLTVTVRYTYSYLVLPAFIEAFASPVTLTGTTVMNME